MSIGERRNLAIPIGVLLVLMSLVTSGSLLSATVLPAGTFVSTPRRAAALIACRVLLLLAAIFLFAKRPRVTSVHVAALAVVTVVSGVLSVALLQFAYTPPRIVSGWRSFAPVAQLNELGYRGRKIGYSSDDFVVLLLGDSQVEAMALPFDAIPERLLESALQERGRQVRVFSVGAGGYGQDQELLALEEYFRTYRADLVVLWQTQSNDIWNNLFKTHMVNRNPKPTFWLDPESRLQGPSEQLGESIGDSPFVLTAIWNRVFGLPRRDRDWEQTLPEPYSPLTSYSGAVNNFWQERWNANLGFMRDENLATEKSHMAVMLTPRSKRMQYGLDLTRALTSRISRTVAAQHGRFLVLQTEANGTAPERDEVYSLNGRHYQVSRDQFYANWEYINRGFDVEVIRITIRDWRVAAEDGHLNAEAANQAMSLLADRLQAKFDGHANGSQ
jgi:hypothetical protein